MNNTHTFSFLLLLGLCNGCVLSSAPMNEANFATAEGIKAFEGCYQNLSEGGANAFKKYLSAVIWPEVKSDHSKIKAVRVVVSSEKTLGVTAETDGKIIHEGQFVEGTDFNLNFGRIKVKGDPMVSLAYPAGNVFIGAGYASQELGIDKSGAGKLQETATFAGTGFLVIPIAGHVRDSYRFRKVHDLCSGS